MKYALIIDSLLSHNSIAGLCDHWGIIPIHIFSSKECFRQHFNKIDATLYKTCFIYENESQFFQEIFDLKNDILFTFACTEPAQRCKDTIDILLGLEKTNDVFYSKERYNKFFLYQKFNQPASQQNFKEFIEQHGSCIVKPASIELTGGCIDVIFRNEYDPKDENGKNFISKYFQGEEFCADLVSYKGQHKLAAAWRYIRNSDEKIWKHKIQLIDYAQEKDLINSIYSAVSKWLSSINHQFGATHVELRYNGQEFFCVEINFRLHGHMSYLALSKALKKTQHSLVLDCYTDRFPIDEDLCAYENTGIVSRIYLLNDRERLSEKVKWKEIDSHRSVQRTWRHVKTRGPLPIAKKNSIDATALVVLYNQDLSQLLEDEQNIFKLFNE